MSAPAEPGQLVGPCEFCGRDGRQLEPCCTGHAAVLVCADRRDCSEFCLAMERQAIAAVAAGAREVTRTMLTGEAPDA